MKIYRFERSQYLPITQDIAWAYFTNPANLTQAYPKSMHIAFESEPPKTLYTGCILSVKAKVMGIMPTKMVTEVKHMEAPDYFIDEQRFGPFQFWHHEHRFTPVKSEGVKNKGVHVQDIVHYSMPIGFIGRLGHGILVKREIEKMFAYREQMLSDFFGEDTP